MISKVFLSALVAAAGASALLQANFTRYFGEECSVFGGSANVVEGYCVNLENFPVTGFDANVISGACDASTSPVVSVYTEPGCETGLYKAFAIDAEAECIAEDVTIQSVTVQCV